MRRQWEKQKTTDVCEKKISKKTRKGRSSRSHGARQHSSAWKIYQLGQLRPVDSVFLVPLARKCCPIALEAEEPKFGTKCVCRGGQRNEHCSRSGGRIFAIICHNGVFDVFFHILFCAYCACLCKVYASLRFSAWNSPKFVRSKRFWMVESENIERIEAKLLERIENSGKEDLFSSAEGQNWRLVSSVA